MDAVARQLMDLCQTDAACAARLGADPWATAQQVVASFDAAHCPAPQVDADGARAWLASLLLFSPLRDYIPVLLYRMQRCAPRDLAAIALFAKTSSGVASLAGPVLGFNDGKRLSFPLQYHVALSEMWHLDGLPDPTAVRGRGRPC